MDSVVILWLFAVQWSK